MSSSGGGSIQPTQNPIELVQSGQGMPVCSTANPICGFQQTIPLEEWEVLLIIIVAYYETLGQDPGQIELAVWTILNRYLADSGSYQNIGDMILKTGFYHVVPDLFAITNEMSSQQMSNMVYKAYAKYRTTKAPRYSSIITDSAVQRALSAIYAFQVGAADPTNGSKFFGHIDAYDIQKSQAWYQKAYNAMAQSQGFDALVVGFSYGEPGKYMIYSNLVEPSGVVNWWCTNQWEPFCTDYD